MNRFINYGRQLIDNSDIRAVVKVLKSDFLTQGPKIEEFEQALCSYTGAKYAVAVSSGTAALHLAVLALDIEKGKEAITSPNTFLASANSIVYSGLSPVLTDIRTEDGNMDLNDLFKKINKNTKVVLPVHFAGKTVDVKNIDKLIDERIAIIEDAAHAIGSKYSDGSKVGSCKWSDMTIFSFHPIKTITTAEGGAIMTNDKSLYKKLCLLRNHGIERNKHCLETGPWYYRMIDLGFNYRLTDIGAALGISQLKKINRFIKKRRQIVQYYNKVFSKFNAVKIPEYDKNACYHLYVMKIDFRKIKISKKEFMLKLKAKGIGTQVNYIPIYKHPFYKENYGFKDKDYPNSEDFYNLAISLPLFVGLKASELKCITEEVIKLVS